MSFFRFAKKDADDSASVIPAAAMDNAPRHVAIIMDGNGRWAKSRGLPRSMGHRKGAETLRVLLEGCRELGLEYLTIYAFSAENWQRPDSEVRDLMDLLRDYLNKEIHTLHQNGVRLRIIGDRAALTNDIREDIQRAETLTSGNRAFNLNVALSYGGRQEIARGMRVLAADIAAGRIAPTDIDDALIAGYLDTKDIPDPDLLIRTGGDQRLSNFLLWQSAYTEFYFTEVLWPDFTLDHMRLAIHDYAVRERRYGKCT